MKTDSLNDIADRYRRLSTRFTDLVEAVPDDRWNRPSPCPEWTAKDVFHHIVTTEAEHLQRMEMDLPEPIDGVEPHAAWPIVRDRVQRALDTPEEAEHGYDGMLGHTTFAASIDRFYSMDLVVHAWDLARATGLKAFEQIPADEIEPVRRAADSFGENMRLPGVFGPEVPVSDDADEQTKLLGLLGRDAAAVAAR